jgi:protein SCO1/2
MSKCFIAAMILLISCGQSKKESEMGSTDLSNHPVSAGKKIIPAESIFQLTDSFQTQENIPFALSMLAGKPTVVGMVFTHCTYACPRLTADIKNIADSLNGQNINFVLVSFDTKRDTSARLKIFADEMKLNKNWILLHGSETTVRTLSVLLHVQYEEDGEGNFSHSNLISVLDKYGVLQYQKEGLGAVHTETITTIKKLIQQP